MKKIIIVIGVILAIKSFGSSSDQQALGRSTYLYTHSKILNIIQPKVSEVEAIRDLLKKIVVRCGNENFTMSSPVYQHSGINNYTVLQVTASARFVCN